MEEVFGNVDGMGIDDLARLDAIHRRLGLVVDGNNEKHDEESGKASHDEKASSE